MRRFEEVFTKSHHLHSIKTSRSAEYDRLLGQLFYLCSSYSHYASAMPQGQSWPSCPGVRTERQRVADSSQSGRQHLELPLCHLQISPDISGVLCYLCYLYGSLFCLLGVFCALGKSQVRQVRIAQILDWWTSLVSGRRRSRSRAAAVADSLWCERTYAKDDAMQALAKKIDTLVFKFMLVSQKCIMTQMTQ